MNKWYRRSLPMQDRSWLIHASLKQQPRGKWPHFPVALFSRLPTICRLHSIAKSGILSIGPGLRAAPNYSPLTKEIRLAIGWRAIRLMAMKRLITSVFVMLSSVVVGQRNPQLPEPPQQHQAWHPDSAIPLTFIPQRTLFFEQGFPDPRGCEYREIEIDCGVVFVTNQWPVKTRGWVLRPKQARQTVSRFAGTD